MMRHIQFAILILLFPWTALHAQEQAVASGKTAPPQLEVTLAYNAVRSNGSTGANFWLQGGKGEFSAAFGRSFSVVGELAAQHVSNINSAAALTQASPGYASIVRGQVVSQKLADISYISGELRTECR